MTFWIVLVGVLFALWLLGRIRVRAIGSYSESGLFLNVKVGPKLIRIIPSNASKKEAAEKKTKKSVAADETEKTRRSTMDTVSVALRFVSLVGEAAGRLIRRIRIDNIVLRIIWAASDPADAAKGYAAANAAMGIIWPMAEHNFNVKEYDLSVNVDFEREKPELVGNAQITITIGQIFSLLLILGFKALKIYLGIRRDKAPKNENEKAVQS